MPVADICRRAGISQATYFNWKKKYEGMGRLCGQHALDAGASEAAPTHPADAAHAGIALAQLPRRIGSAIRRIVVDENDLVGNARQSAVDAREHPLHIAALVEGGDDDGSEPKDGGKRFRGGPRRFVWSWLGAALPVGAGAAGRLGTEGGGAESGILYEMSCGRSERYGRTDPA